MDSLKNLGGQEYVDIYATKAKEILSNPQADSADAENAADAEEN
jgi:hypothetical protein